MIADDRLRESLEAALGRSVGTLERRPLSGGCINEAFELRAGAERWFVKGNDRALPGQFEAEARGLEALRSSGTSLVIPRVVAWSDAGEGARFLVTEFLEPGPRVADFDERLGRGLAELHAFGDPRGFGFDVDGYCGATPQPNPWTESWVEFYRDHRLGHLRRSCARRGMAAEDLAALDRLIERLDEWIDDAPESSLIHGDLWSGNLHVDSEGRPALIDPAAYFAHSEAELGMMSLFGGFGPRVWQSYAEARRPAPGWRNRLPLYELYHLLNHFVLFGGSYGAQAMQVVRRFVG